MRLILFLVITVILFSIFTVRASANHSWGSYHWARTGNPFSLKLGNNLSPGWSSYLSTTSTDWSISPVLDTTIVSGSTSSRRCRPSSGRVEVCNYTYGNNGWLGMAQIWASGDHITQGVMKVNDTYFNRTQYNIPAWKNLVMCQEVGHTLGLNHQDEEFNNANLGTCMDYTTIPDSNQHPNAHDYEQLQTIYSHYDSTSTLQNVIQKLPFSKPFSEKTLGNDFENRAEWGRKVKDNGHVALYERDLGKGNKIFTFTIWAQE